MRYEDTTALTRRLISEVRTVTQVLPRAEVPRRSVRRCRGAGGLALSLLLHGAALGVGVLVVDRADRPAIPEATVLCAALHTATGDDVAECLDPDCAPPDEPLELALDQPCEAWELAVALQPDTELPPEPEFDLPEEPELWPHVQELADPSALLSAARRAPSPAPSLPAFRPPTPRAQPVRDPMTQTPRPRAMPTRPSARASGSSSRKGLRVTYAPDPRRYYPAESVRRGVEGTARVGLLVDARGYVTRAWIEVSSGDNQLDRAALALIHAYRFEPPGTARRTRMPVSFHLARPTSSYSVSRRSR